MVILGADLHKRWHTVVAVDGQGRKLAELTVAATPEGHLELRRWAAHFPEREWALEDCHHLSRRLEAGLVRAGEAVVRVPPKLMAGARRSVREPGKSDPIDALAVARAALANPDLPIATLDGPERELRMLVDHRDDLVAERTRNMARLRWFLLDLGVPEPPARSPPPRSSARAPASAASAPRPPSPATTARHRSRCGRATRHVTGCPGAATASSTWRSTGSPSPICGSTSGAAPTSSTGATPGTPRPRRSGPSAGACRMRYSDASRLTRHDVPVPPPP